MGDPLTLETADAGGWFAVYAAELTRCNLAGNRAARKDERDRAEREADMAVRAYRERCREPAPGTRARRGHEGHTTRLAGILGVSESANTMDDLLDLLAGRAPTRGADGLNYLAAKSDAVMWESRAKKLAESISREIGPAADGVADEDLWELVQALAAARGDS